MDPISAVANAVAVVVDNVFARSRARWENRPEWLDPADYRRTNYTPYIILIGGLLVLGFLVWAIAKTNK